MNILGVLLLGCIEFIFFTQIVIHYQQLTTDELYLQIINRIRNLPIISTNPQSEKMQFELAKQLLTSGLLQTTQEPRYANNFQIE